MGLNKKTCNYGIYADLIQQYIAYKRSLGFKMEDTEKTLSTVRHIDTGAEREQNRHIQRTV